jgi:hypothetical protein
MITDSLNFFDSSLGGKIPKRYQLVCVVFAERRGLVIIVGITMNVLIEKRTEVMQTLLSMIEPTENERGCLSCQSKETARADDLIRLIRRKVITGKNITT